MNHIKFCLSVNNETSIGPLFDVNNISGRIHVSYQAVFLAVWLQSYFNGTKVDRNVILLKYMHKNIFSPKLADK